MAEYSSPRGFELVVLLVIFRLSADVYGVLLPKELERLYSRGVSVGSAYAALDRVETKGLVASNLGEAIPARGGRAKRYFRLNRQRNRLPISGELL